MNRTTSTIMTTAAVGMAVGAAAYMMSGNTSNMRSKTKKIRKNAGRALRQAGEFIENVSYMMK